MKKIVKASQNNNFFACMEIQKDNNEFNNNLKSWLEDKEGNVIVVFQTELKQDDSTSEYLILSSEMKHSDEKLLNRYFRDYSLDSEFSAISIAEHILNNSKAVQSFLSEFWQEFYADTVHNFGSFSIEKEKYEIFVTVQNDHREDGYVFEEVVVKDRSDNVVLSFILDLSERILGKLYLKKDYLLSIDHDFAAETLDQSRELEDPEDEFSDYDAVIDHHIAEDFCQLILDAINSEVSQCTLDNAKRY
ncbi:hypothetical protein ACTL6P_15380 [Endozoicomonas acroporae]|uniref:hypothetical protein n=1 Tax=Endozoicomonas acroporae TaxID=1701104 RepID=UPI000C76B1A1|nr:hypothetical protein [Endozoicomonas acroporae]